MGFFASLLAALMLGLRHGADPDHLAAIDNLTRNAARSRPAASRFVGTLFAAGHTLMILAIALVISLLGQRFGSFGAHLERAGSFLSVAVLLIMAGLNVRRLLTGGDALPAGLRTRLLAPLVRSADIYAALPVGFLFGLGFETSSQIAAYVVIASGGISTALAIGAAFCLGMVCTDTFDSVILSRFIRSGNGAAVGRAWLWTVTGIALAVAVYESLQLAHLDVRLPELVLSGLIVAACTLVFFIVLAGSRKPLTVKETRGS